MSPPDEESFPSWTATGATPHNRNGKVRWTRVSRASALSILANFRRIAPILAVALAATTARGRPPEAAKAPAVPADHEKRVKEGLALFKEQVRPVLVEHCLDCHGGKATKGEFDLSDRKPLVDSGAIDGGAKESQPRTP